MAAPTRPAERYGDIRPAWHSTLARVLVVTLGGLALVWLGYIGVTASMKPVRWSDIGYQVIDSTKTEVTFDVTVYDGPTATCEVRALAEDYSVVGSSNVKVDVAGRDSTTMRKQVVVATGQQAVTGIVHECTTP